MFVSLTVGLCGLLLAGCETCLFDPDTAWVACVDGKAVLLGMRGGKPTNLGRTLAFDPKKWDCKTPNSPSPTDTLGEVYPTGTATGPHIATAFEKGHAVAANTPFLARRLLDLPLIPPVPEPALPPDCQASFPDVINVNHTLASVARISTCPFQIRLTIPVVSRPLQVAITPDGKTALVTSFDNAINFIDLASNKVTFTLNTPLAINPNGIKISSDGTRTYITSFNNINPVVQVIEMSTRKVLTSIPVDTYPQGVYLSPDGSQLWVTFPFGQAVYVIDTLSNTVSTLIPIPQTTGVAFNAQGTTAYVTTSAVPAGFVMAVDTATFKVVGSYTVGLGPTDVALTYGEQYLIVNNNGGGSVSAIDLSTGVVNTTVVGDAPRGLAFVK